MSSRRPPPGIRVVPLDRDLWEAGGRAAYAAGIATGHATFRESAPEWAEFVEGKLAEHLLAAVDDATRRCVGWACVSPAFSRCVYAGVVEDSVYVDAAVAGRGIGRLLLQALLDSADAGGLWTVESLIFPENTASLALHRDLGFRDVGVRERLGLMTYGPLAGRWRDVVLLERRVP